MPNQAGRLHDAERLCRAILQARPNHPDAHHNLGILAVQVKQLAAGLPHFKTALEAEPAQGQYWLSYIGALIQCVSSLAFARRQSSAPMLDNERLNLPLSSRRMCTQ